jgi:hypothetical protein
MLSFRVCLCAGWNCTGLGKLYKCSGGHHGAKMNFSEHVDVMVGKVYVMLESYFMGI